MRLYNPQADTPKRTWSPARRLEDFSGRRVGFLDNSKWNAGKLLAEIAALLRKQYPLTDMVQIKKPSFAQPAEGELYEELSHRFDAVITAIGD